MSNVKGLPGCVDYSHTPQRPHGTMHGFVRLLAKSPRHRIASFFLNDRKMTIATQELPSWFQDGAHVEIEFSEHTTITLITQTPCSKK